MILDFHNQYSPFIYLLFIFGHENLSLGAREMDQPPKGTHIKSH